MSASTMEVVSLIPSDELLTTSKYRAALLACKWS
jgi:hypothetical protein